MALLGRGRNYPRFRARVEAIENRLFRNSWPARLAFKLGLQNNIKTTNYPLKLRNYPEDVPSLKIGFLSDFHAGLVTHPKMIARSIAKIQVENPDIILLGGDFVDFDPGFLDDVLRPLQKLQPPLGIFAVLGNHDLWSDDATIQSELEAIGITFLINEGVHLPAPFDGIYLCGLDEWFTGFPDSERAFANNGCVNIVLMHNPANYLDIKNRNFDVAFCGHTHAGQIALPFQTPIVMPRDPYCRKYSYGKFKVGKNRQSNLIVTSGIGYHTLPFRFLAWPEVVVCTISGKK
ncbi:MAG: metallophosphoesterase [Calditrichaeota bacterium]|nr:MAG: metallophosphoesterase [Calditrichota bacterium]